MHPGFRWFLFAIVLYVQYSIYCQGRKIKIFQKRYFFYHYILIAKPFSTTVFALTKILPDFYLKAMREFFQIFFDSKSF